MEVFLGGPPLSGVALVEKRRPRSRAFIELGLREVRSRALVAAVAVDDDHFLCSRCEPSRRRFLQQGELHPAAVSHGSGLGDGLRQFWLKIIFGKGQSRYSFSAACSGGITDVQQIGAEREMRSVLLQDAEGKQAGSLRADECLRGNRQR